MAYPAIGKKAVLQALVDSMLADYRNPLELIGENAVIKQLSKLLVPRFDFTEKTPLVFQIARRIHSDGPVPARSL
jgi:hypothetical protein